MILQSTRYAVCLGLLAGSLAIANAPAHAEVPVTDGRATGDAAFFVPGTGNTVLFDAGVRTLRLVTPNGVTTTSRFIPTAGRLDPIGNRVPQAGDTGTLEGVLSGVAFSAAGNPVFFQGVPTNLDFTLNSFTSSGIFGGTLISPVEVGSAPVVFLPLTNVQLSESANTTFEADPGNLHVGPFEANLPSGTIDLPSDVRFSSTGSVVETPAFVGRRFKFDIAGRGFLDTFNLAPDGSQLQFTSNDAQTEFRVQSVGTPASREFKIEGTGTGAELNIRGVTEAELQQSGTALAGGLTRFDVRGDGVGITSLLGNNALSYVSNDSRTRFEVENNNIELEGRSQGQTQFNIGVIGSSLTPYTYTPGSSTGTTVFDTSSGETASSEVITSTQTTTSLFSTSTRSITFVTTSYNFRASDVSLFILSPSSTITRNVVYTVYRPASGPGRFAIYKPGRGPGQGRGLALGRRNRSVVAYTIVGPTSRVFPGLVGTRELTEIEIEELGLESILGVEGIVGLPQLPPDEAAQEEDDEEVTGDVEDNDDGDDDGDDDEDDDDSSTNSQTLRQSETETGTTTESNVTTESSAVVESESSTTVEAGVTAETEVQVVPVTTESVTTELDATTDSTATTVEGESTTVESTQGEQ